MVCRCRLKCQFLLSMKLLFIARWTSGNIPATVFLDFNQFFFALCCVIALARLRPWQKNWSFDIFPPKIAHILYTTFIEITFYLEVKSSNLKKFSIRKYNFQLWNLTEFLCAVYIEHVLQLPQFCNYAYRHLNIFVKTFFISLILLFYKIALPSNVLRIFNMRSWYDIILCTR